MPKASVLITLYNKGAFVEEAVRSMLNQGFRDIEVVVVDDASTDGGLEKVRGIQNPRIRIIESPVNTGRPAAANRGLDAVRGEYVAVLEAMASGLPVVATSHAGIPEVVAEGERGLLCAEYDVEAMAANMLHLAGDAALAGHMGPASRLYVEQHHRVEDQVATLQTLLESVAVPARGHGH